MSGTRQAVIVALSALGPALAGCGGSSKSSSVASATSGASTSTATAVTTSGSPAPAQKRQPKPAPPRRLATVTTGVPTSSGPSGASAPDGLRPASGYSSYDNCMGSCGGAVPASLERPLHLPSGSCQVSGSHSIAGTTVLGNGAVGPAQPGSLPLSAFIRSAWAGARVNWIASPGYGGPVLIRGGQLGSSRAVGFGLGNVPYGALQLKDSAGSSSGGPRQWPAFTRVRGPGCYAYQVDGTSFSDVIVFRAR